ncbi:MAG TPA: hypothetical protein VJP45_00475 [Candidatus Limnocylindria bacterium]|nr:hypothetical protein [Candidatus Limnocylindria bacterium]
MNALDDARGALETASRLGEGGARFPGGVTVQLVQLAYAAVQALVSIAESAAEIRDELRRTAR